MGYWFYIPVQETSPAAALCHYAAFQSWLSGQGDNRMA